MGKSSVELFCRLAVTAALAIYVPAGLADPLIVAQDPLNPSVTVVVARAVSRSLPAEKGGEAKWNLEVSETPQGNDVNGDIISSGAQPDTYQVGKSYVLWLHASGEGATAERSEPATGESIAAAKKAITETGGKSRSRLRLWVHEGVPEGFGSFELLADNTFSCRLWLIDRPGGARHAAGRYLAADYEGSMPDSVAHDIVRRFVAAPVSHRPRDPW